MDTSHNENSFIGIYEAEQPTWEAYPIESSTGKVIQNVVGISLECGYVFKGGKRCKSKDYVTSIKSKDIILAEYDNSRFFKVLTFKLDKSNVVIYQIQFVTDKIWRPAISMWSGNQVAHLFD